MLISTIIYMIFLKVKNIFIYLLMIKTSLTIFSNDLFILLIFWNCKGDFKNNFYKFYLRNNIKIPYFELTSFTKKNVTELCKQTPHVWMVTILERGVIGPCLPLGSQSNMNLTFTPNSLPSLVSLIYFM